MTWDDRWMEMARMIAGWSKDESRKTSAVIVDSRNALIAVGWNGFPRGLHDSKPERLARPAKYLWTEHAERNAIFNAAANGARLLGCRMYMPWYPCADCARAIIQSGIEELICIEPDWNDERWAADFAVVAEMLSEASVSARFVAGEPPQRLSA